MNSFIRGSYDVHVACYEMFRAMEKILNNVIIEKYRLLCIQPHWFYFFNLSASDTANVWQKSRILLIADLGSSMIDAEKLQTSFLGADQANLGNEFVILQRARDGGFESHGSFQTLASVQDR